MTQIFFYHLYARQLEQALPTLLEKANGRGFRSLVMVGVEERVEPLADHLWSYRPDSFLPHGTAADGYAAHQPIYLTSTSENPNGASVLFLVDGAWRNDLAEFERVAVLFNGRDEQAVQTARSSWRACRSAGYGLAYWQESGEGQWRKVASAAASSD